LAISQLTDNWNKYVAVIEVLGHWKKLQKERGRSVCAAVLL